ncbi:thrombopoietin receptor isoform X2 [Apteryx mantelli]|uniref:Thrombopoietin receptor isoform X2 n=1 Tax=Apteryx mantelli TaxID=2696672 RepID=A0ABM4EWR8_9AVES
MGAEGAFQPGFLSSKVDTSQIKVSPVGAPTASQGTGKSRAGARAAPCPGAAPRGAGMATWLHQGWLLSLLAEVLLSLLSPALPPEPVTSEGQPGVPGGRGGPCCLQEGPGSPRAALANGSTQPQAWLPALRALLESRCSLPHADAALLDEVPEDILCFSRSFEDLTCFWDEEEEEEATSGKCHFYYWYSREVPKACTVSTQSRGASGMRHVCVFPSQDVRLFSQLFILIVNATSNQTKYSRELSVDAVGLIAPPRNITATWTGVAGQLWVTWQPPLEDYLNFFLYEVRYCMEGSGEAPCSVTLDPSGQHTGDPLVLQASSTQVPTPEGAAASPGAGQGLVQTDSWVLLRDLRPGVRYHIQVRSKPDGLSMDGMWGPWSQAVAAETPHSSGDIGLLCTTPDLQHVRCEWSWDPADASSSHELFYRAPQSRAGKREEAWQRCEAVSVGAQGTHTCTFQPRAGSAISVLVNVTWPHTRPTLSYFREPFWLHQAVLTDPPQLLQATVVQGRLSLQWVPPLEELGEQLAYQLRYSVENSHDWKVLQVPRAARKEVLDLRPGARYLAQVRAQPSGPWYQGNWSAWSKPVVVDAMADAGWIIPSVAVVPLLFTGMLLGLRCTFPSLYSVKQKLWPPVPDLHRALGNFLNESSKHSQANAFYKQPPEDAVLPCLLEVLPDRRAAELAAPPKGPQGREEAGGPPQEYAAGRLPGGLPAKRGPPWGSAERPAPTTDIANQSYLLMSGWEPRGPP